MGYTNIMKLKCLIYYRSVCKWYKLHNARKSAQENPGADTHSCVIRTGIHSFSERQANTAATAHAHQEFYQTAYMHTLLNMFVSSPPAEGEVMKRGKKDHFIRMLTLNLLQCPSEVESQQGKK